MAEIKRKPVVYTYGPEGREACWTALTNSWNELARRQKNSSSSDELMAWTTAHPAEETGEIDSTTWTTTTTVTVPEETATSEIATTPPPPPMMRSPPKLERRTAVGGHHRRRSYHEWDTPPSNGRAGGSGRFRFDWNDDAAAAEQARSQWPPSSCEDDGEDRSRPSTPASFGSTATFEDETMMFVDEHEVSTAVSADEQTVTSLVQDEQTVTSLVQDEQTVTSLVQDEQAVTSLVQDEQAVTSVVQDEPAVTAAVQHEPTVTAVVQDEPTVTAVESSDTGNASDPPLPFHCIGEDEAHHDEQTADNKPSPPPQPPRASGYRETKIKEIDDTIVSYSKSLLITVLVVVLIRVFF